MNVSAWSIRNPVAAMMIFALLTLAGVISFQAMKVQNFPDIELPTVIVTANLPGAAPGQLENDVARKIENAVATLQEVKHIYTKLVEGTATVSVEFRIEKDAQIAVDDVRSAVARIRSDLPADLRDPIVSKVELSGIPILTIAVTAPALDAEALSWFVDDTLTKALLGVPGVGRVARVGGVTREIRIELDPTRLASLGATAAEVSRQLRQTQQEAAGGRTEVGGSEQAVRMIATARTVEDIASLQIYLNEGRRVRLDQLASVRDTVGDERSAALLDGKPVIGFEVSRSRGASEVTVGAGVRAVLEKIRVEHPGVSFAEASDFVAPVQESYDGSMLLLYEGAILAVLVVFLFLRNVRATFVAATALPLSIVPTFIGMHYLGFSINVVTLLSLSLVVGVLVDDAIVEIENIVRHLRMGKSPYQAAMEAADEIGLAVIATTITLVAVFLPTAFMSGIAGKFFKQFGWTAALAVMASLLVARMLTPMMAAYLLKPIVKPHRDGWIMASYLAMTRWCIRYRWLTVLAGAAFVALGVMFAANLPTGFIPPDDIPQTQVTLELPPGSTFTETRVMAERAREIVKSFADVRQIYTAIGSGTQGADPFTASALNEPRKATLMIRLSDRHERSVKKQAIEGDLRTALAALPGVRYSVGAGGSGEKYVLVLASDDGQALARAARDVERDLRTIPGLGNTTSSASLVRAEVVIRPDPARAADLGVTSAALGETLRVATLGDYDNQLAKLNLPQRQIPIVVRLPASARQDLATIERLRVPTVRGGTVMLGQVASVAIESGPAQIERYDRRRNINFDIELNGQPLGSILEAVAALPSVQALPTSVVLADVGDAETMRELFASFGLAMLTGVLCIFAVLVVLFKDFFQPFTILMALVLSIPGAIFALLVTNTALSMPSMIGLIMLMGIVTKNSILLVEYAIVARRDQGMTRLDALVDACHKRARPIVMTTLAMGAGMLPIALGIGVDPSFRSPMAIVVIGGLITSTVLSLLVIPAVYTLVDDLERGLAALWRRRPGAPAPA